MAEPGGIPPGTGSPALPRAASDARAPVAASRLIAAGTPQLRRLRAAMICAGLAGFALLYATQALLPDIGRTFGSGATLTSLTVSVATGSLALAVLPVSALAERLGRTRVMTLGLAVAFVSVIAGALAPALWVLLVFRAVDGVALAGVIAVAMGHIGASVRPELAAPTIGVYVSGTSVGGLIGRLVPAAVSEAASWRWSMVALALVGGACTVAFARLVPSSTQVGVGVRPGPDAVGASARFSSPPGPPATTASERHAPLRSVLADSGVLRLCGVALTLMGGFVATYNYLTYRLIAAPFDLRPSTAGFVFVAYLAGTVTSTLASRLSERVGRRTVVLASIALALAGLALTLADDLVAVLVGLVIFTAGFFGAHGTASGWTSARAPQARTIASACYVTAYYLGSSVGGTLIGFAWSAAGWPATAACVAGCLLVAAVLAGSVGGHRAADVHTHTRLPSGSASTTNAGASSS